MDGFDDRDVPAVIKQGLQQFNHTAESVMPQTAQCGRSEDG
jgi:hypothetical protein